MEWNLILQVFIASLLGFSIGIEREIHHSSAGIRTYAAIALGACLFGIISTHVSGPSIYKSIVDPSRIAAQIVSGIGFIGAGVIFKSGVTTRGLTTAATLWVTAAVGLAVAVNMIALPVFVTVLVILILSLSHSRFWVNFKNKISSRTHDNNDT
ncbi:MAG TPA: MgtC/SapB family protein [Victivallales bacterium]|nr:MgtC/SapB family protein [Victivallales bacterium]